VANPSGKCILDMVSDHFLVVLHNEDYSLQQVWPSRLLGQ
jgi:hypothetical protein